MTPAERAREYAAKHYSVAYDAKECVEMAFLAGWRAAVEASAQETQELVGIWFGERSEEAAARILALLE